MMTYEILETNMDALRKTMKKIAKKCQAYNAEFHFAEIGETFKEVETADGKLVNCRFVIVETEGIAKINNWEFIATIDHLETGNVINKAFSDIEIPERFRTAECTCEHCNTKRYRKNSYIVHNTETNEFKQVGKSCLKDYTNGLDAAHAAILMEAKTLLEEAQNVGSMSSGSYTRYYKLIDFLQYAIETVKHFGYVPTSGVYSTKAHASDFLYLLEENWAFSPATREELNNEIVKYNFEALTEDNENTAHTILEWICFVDDTSDFMSNLKTLAKSKYVTPKHFGYIVAMIPAYNRAHKNEVKESETVENNSEFQGAIGARLNIEVESCNIVTSWSTQWGTTILYKIIDTNNNIYIWKSSKLLDCLPVKAIVGTVKAHNTYNKENQTELTRCIVTYDRPETV